MLKGQLVCKGAVVGRLKAHCGGSPQQHGQVCIFLLYLSNLSQLADTPFQSCSTAGLPHREDAPFSLDLSLLPPCGPALLRKYPRLVLGL